MVATIVVALIKTTCSIVTLMFRLCHLYRGGTQNKLISRVVSW